MKAWVANKIGILYGRSAAKPLLVFGLLSICVFSPAQVYSEIYRYQDEHGKWHFTDDKKHLNTDAPELVTLEKNRNVMGGYDDRTAIDVFVPKDLCLQNKPSILKNLGYKGSIGKKGGFTVLKKGAQALPTFVAKNDYFVSVTLKLWLEKNTNMQPSRALPLTIEVKPHSQVDVLSLRPRNPSQTWSYSYNYQTEFGAMNVFHDSQCLYLPPIPPGRGFLVSQASYGEFSHSDSHSLHAVDISMPLGTDVLVARDGIVFQVEEGFVLSGLSEAYKRKANVVRILHSDGTIAVYAHLQFRTIKFREGEPVRAGQVIGKSGDTGYSTGPHLHFGIEANQNMSMTSLPFKFYHDGQAITAKTGMYLKNPKSKASTHSR